MFANLLQLISRRPPPNYEGAFIRGVKVTRPVVRSRRTQRFILAGWLLIVAKSWLVIWAVARYHVPINPLWVIVPTVLFALMCTLVYFRGE